MLIPIGSTEPIALGPFETSMGTIITAGSSVAVALYVNGVVQAATGTVANTDANGFAEYTPSAADTATAGELVIAASVAGALPFFVRHEITGMLQPDGAGGQQFTAKALALGLTQQFIRDALKLAATAGPPAVGSVDALLATVASPTDVASAVSGLATSGQASGIASAVAALPGVGAIQSGLATATAVAAIPTNPLRTNDTRLPSTTIAAKADVAGIPAANASAIWNNTQRTLTGTGGAIGPTAGANLGPIAFGPVVPGQTLDLSACVSINGQYATIEGTSAVAYTITDCETGKAVPGHSNVSLTPASVLHDTLQTDGEASNYNFRFRPSIALGLPFPESGHYLVAVTFTVGGQPYFANFRGDARY